MKKLLIICILIISIIFISGCTSDEQASSDISTSSQNNPESDTQNSGLIIKQSDVPRLTLDFHTFYSVPKNTLYEPTNFPKFIYHGIDLDCGAGIYTDTLNIGHRNVGEKSTWKDQSGKQLYILVMKFDSDPNSSLINSFLASKESFATMDYNDISDPNIGDYSFSLERVEDPDTDVQMTLIEFIHGTTYVVVQAIDEKDISKKTAIRIAKIIESRLD